MEAGAEVELEDAQQILRIKVWRALKSFDPAKCRTNRRKYVNMCLTDQKKDLLKKKRRYESHLEDMLYEPAGASNGGESTLDYLYFSVQKHLTTEHDDVYGLVDDDDVLIPSTVTLFEKAVLLLLYTGDYKQREIAQRLLPELYEYDEDGAKREVERAIRALRDKFADWRPNSENPIPAVAA